nr:hypothetical protein [Erythrobacter sp.]
MHLAFGNVAHYSHEAGQLAIGIELRGNRQVVPEGFAILSVIEYLAIELLAVLNGFLDALLSLGAGVLSLKETAIPSDYLGVRISGDFTEISVGVCDRLRRISKYHSMPDGIDDVLI